MMSDFILSLDQGTTSSRAILFNRQGEVKGIDQQEFKQYFPNDGWVEHDPMEIWSSQQSVIRGALAGAGIRPSDLAGIGITNQRETALIWDRRTGLPLCRAIVWQDRRTADYCDELKAGGFEGMIRDKTGLVIDPYFSASKWRWMLEHVPGSRERALKGELALGTVDSWLVWNLTGGKVHATDVTNASRTMLFNIHTLEWDKELLDLFGIPENMLPRVGSSSELFGHTDEGVLPGEVIIGGIAGDQQAATFGQLCLSEGTVKCTYGTGCFILCNTGEVPVASNNNLVTTIAWQLGDHTVYALEGSIFTGGSVIQWLRDGLGLISDSSKVEALAGSVKDNGGVYFVPAFTGLGAPHWDPYARGMICGLTRGSTSGHIARAALESIAFQVHDVIGAMKEDARLELSELKVDGGASVNDLLMQFQSDLTGIPVTRPKIIETTALGAAYLAGLSTGFWSSTEEIRSHWDLDRTFECRSAEGERQQWEKGWRRAVARTKSTPAQMP